MDTTVENPDRDPESTQSYNYHSTSNPNPGGTTVTTDVTPVDAIGAPEEPAPVEEVIADA